MSKFYFEIIVIVIIGKNGLKKNYWLLFKGVSCMNVKIDEKIIIIDWFYLRKIGLEDIDDIYSIVKKDMVGIWFVVFRGMIKEEIKVYVEKFIDYWN